MAGKKERAGTIRGRPHVHVEVGTGEEVHRVVLEPGHRRRWRKADGTLVPGDRVEVKWK